MRIRYYGFLANRNRSENMARCRAAVTGNPEYPLEHEDTIAEIELNIAELEVVFPVCPRCRSTRLTLTKEIPKQENNIVRHLA